MLIEFKFKNFLSFRDESSLNMVASSDRSNPENTMTLESFGGKSITNTAAIYGANASGKSNLFSAINFARNFIVTSAENKPDSKILVKPFLLNDDSANESSEFEFNFIHRDVRYQFGFSVDKEQVSEEWLIAYPFGRPQKWFERTLNSEQGYEWYFGPKFRGDRVKLKEFTKKTSLFLSVAATFNHEQIVPVFDWFNNYLRVISTQMIEPLESYTIKQVMAKESFRNLMRQFLKIADLGILDFTVKKVQLAEKDLPSEIPEEFRRLILSGDNFDIRMQHKPIENRIGGFLSWGDESHGTVRLFALGGPWFDTLNNGYTLIVDELDSSLHPHIVRDMVHFFHNPNVNAQGAQLVFNTHDVTLLDLAMFRRDQIWFIEKDDSGASHLYSLWDFSPRKDEALARGYLQGRYGAIPFIKADLMEGFFLNGKA